MESIKTQGSQENLVFRLNVPEWRQYTLTENALANQ